MNCLHRRKAQECKVDNIGHVNNLSNFTKNDIRLVDSLLADQILSSQGGLLSWKKGIPDAFWSRKKAFSSFDACECQQCCIRSSNCVYSFNTSPPPSSLIALLSDQQMKMKIKS